MRFLDSFFVQTVNSSNETLKKRVEAVLDMALTTVTSLSETFVTGQPIVAEDAAAKDEQIDEELAPPPKAETATADTANAIEVHT